MRVPFNSNRKNFPIGKPAGLLISMLVMLLVIILSGANASAAPACPEPYTFKQPGGQSITVINKGDEFLNWQEDLRGNLLAYENETFYYATWTDNGAKATNVRASDLTIFIPGSKGGDIPDSLRNKTAKLIEQRAERSERVAPELESNAAPINPQRKLLMIYASYDADPQVGDNLPSHLKMTAAQVNSLLFGGSGSGSVNDYYMKLLGTNINVIVPATGSGITTPGVITVSLPGNHPNPRGNSSQTKPMMHAAINAAIAQGLNLSEFTDSGYLSTAQLSIGVIFQGYETSFEMPPGPSFWGSAWEEYGGDFGDVNVESAFGQGSIHMDHTLTIGIIAHELGHSGYGFDDTYNYGTMSVLSVSSGMDTWSLMSSGNWTYAAGEYAGESPSYADAYNLVTYGLIVPETLPYSYYGTKTVSDHAQIYKIKPRDSDSQYFLLQQRINVDFDRGMFNRFYDSTDSAAGGLLIYHVDTSVPLFRINDKRTHYKAGIEEAHGYYQHLQIEPGMFEFAGAHYTDMFGNGKSAFSMETGPVSGLYSAFTMNQVPPTQTTDSGVYIRDISYSPLTGQTAFTVDNPWLDDYAVTYNYSENGGNWAERDSEMVRTGSEIDLNVDAVKPGWEFVGWNTDKNAREELYSLDMEYSDVTLYAIFEKRLNGYFVDYDGETQQIRDHNDILYNKETTGSLYVPAQNTCTGWNSMGGYSTSTLPGSYYGFHSTGSLVSITEDTTFYGLYQRLMVIVYDANGGDYTPPMQRLVQYVNSYDITNYSPKNFELMGELERPGYTFKGWATSADGSVEYNAGQLVPYAGSMTLYAVWESNGGGLKATEPFFLLTDFNSKGILNVNNITFDNSGQKTVINPTGETLVINGSVGWGHLDPQSGKSFPDDYEFVRIRLKLEDGASPGNFYVKLYDDAPQNSSLNAFTSQTAPNGYTDYLIPVPEDGIAYIDLEHWASGKVTIDSIWLSGETSPEAITTTTAVTTTTTTKSDIKTVVMRLDNLYAAVNSQKVRVNDAQELTPIMNEGGRTMVPFRFIATCFGADVDWDGGAGSVIIDHNGKHIVIPIGKSFAYVDGVQTPINAPAQIMTFGRTFVPFRAVTELLGGVNVEWDSGSATIIASDGEINVARCVAEFNNLIR